MTSRFILTIIIGGALFVWMSWPLIVETIGDLLRRADIGPDLGELPGDDK